MTTVSAIHFAALLIIVGAIFRFLESKFPDTTIGKALTFVY